VPEPDAGPTPGQDAGPLGPVRLRIEIDTRFDTYGWVTDERRAVIEQAAAAWGRLLDDDFPTVPAGSRLLVRDPESPEAPGVPLTLDGPIDDIVVFVAAAAFDGRGGVSASSFPTATLDTGDVELDAALTERYDGEHFQPWTGWISFDVAERWFADETPAFDDDLPGDHFDLYSTALHELGHVLGFGSSAAFVDLVDNAGAFAGPSATRIFGDAVPLANDAAHFPDDLRFEGERPLMDVSDPEGARFTPTALDLAVPEDLGYTLVQ
jgi:hypothetical protein